MCCLFEIVIDAFSTFSFLILAFIVFSWLFYSNIVSICICHVLKV